MDDTKTKFQADHVDDCAVKHGESDKYDSSPKWESDLEGCQSTRTCHPYFITSGAVSSMGVNVLSQLHGCMIDFVDPRLYEDVGFMRVADVDCFDFIIKHAISTLNSYNEKNVGEIIYCFCIPYFVILEVICSAYFLAQLQQTNFSFLMLDELSFMSAPLYIMTFWAINRNEGDDHRFRGVVHIKEDEGDGENSVLAEQDGTQSKT